MYNDLPELAQQKVMALLAQDDFVSAKHLYDQWVQDQSSQKITAPNL